MTRVAQSPVCRICGAAAGHGQFLRTFAERGSEVLGLYRCRGCGCEYLDPQPSAAWLESNYAGYFAKRQASLDHPKVTFFRRLLQQTGLDLAGRAVLEVGAAEGDGVLAVHALWPDCRITALDGHPESAPYSQGLPCRFINAPVEDWLRGASAERFDACLLLDVLEHLRDPVAVLQELAARHLEPGALVVATFPNAEALSRRLLGRCWLHYTAEHLYYLSRVGVAAMGRRSGLKTLRFCPLTKRLPLGYVLDVASHFGPTAAHGFGRTVRALVPRFCHRLLVRVTMGEWLWVAQREA